MYDFFEKLLTQFSLSDQEILKIDFNKQIEKANLKYAFNKVKKRNDFKKLKLEWYLKILKLWGLYVFLSRIYHKLFSKK